MHVDLHSHILPGVDDGPRAIDEAVSLAHAYLNSGICRVVATPHVNARWGHDVERCLEAFDTLSDRLTNDRVGLELDFGGEIALTSALDLETDQLLHFRLAGGDWLLIEPPSEGPEFAVHSMIFEVQTRGHRVLLAHPERCQTFQKDLDLLESLVKGGVRTQVTASALSGQFGAKARRTAEDMFKRDLVHMVASDAHHANKRPPGLDAELKQSGHNDLIQWLCHDMPVWILDGGEEPARPSVDVGRQRGSKGILGRLGLRS